MVSVVQPGDGTIDLEGSDVQPLGFVTVNIEWTASSVSKTSFVATRHYVVKSITARVEAAGTDAGAVTAQVAKVASGTAIASGTALTSATVNLKGTAATNQVMTVAATDIPTGTAIGVIFAGTLTAATGCVTVSLAPA